MWCLRRNWEEAVKTIEWILDHCVTDDELRQKAYAELEFSKTHYKHTVFSLTQESERLATEVAKLQNSATEEVKNIDELINYISDTVEEKYGVQGEWFHNHLEQIALAARRISRNK